MTFVLNTLRFTTITLSRDVVRRSRVIYVKFRSHSRKQELVNSTARMTDRDIGKAEYNRSRVMLPVWKKDFNLKL